MSKSSNTTSALSIINGLKGSPQDGMCCCPAHDDRNPSLHVSEVNDKVLFKCHAGCAQEQVLAALRARGLWHDKRNGRPVLSTSRPADNDNERAHEDHARFMRAFAILRAAARFSMEHTERSDLFLGRYFKSRGLNVPTIATLLPKSACERLVGIRCPALVLPVIDNSGKLLGAHTTLLSGDGRTKLDPDNPRRNRRMFGPIKSGFIQLGEVDPKKPLIIAEGAETALSAMQMTGMSGLAAMSATNMESIAVPDCTNIIIAADNDEPGRNAARIAAQRWADAGRAVQIAIPTAPAGTKKYDWNDALLSDASRDELRDAILSAKTFKASRKVRALAVEDFMKLEFPERTFLVQPWLTRSSLAMIHAPRGAAKTWLALSAAYAVAAGNNLMHWNVGEPARVLYVDGELPGKLLQKRLKLLGPYTPNLMVLSRDLFHMRKMVMPDLGELAGRAFLDEIIERHDIDLVVLDSLSTLVRSGVENDAESWAPIQDWALQHRWRDRTILFVHHEGRAGKPRGSSKREDVLDTMIGLKPRLDLSDHSESAFDLTFTKSREFYGADAAPLLVRLSVEAGKIEWSCQLAEENTRDRVSKLLAEDWKQADIAKELGVTPGRVSQIAKEAKRRQLAA